MNRGNPFEQMTSKQRKVIITVMATPFCLYALLFCWLFLYCPYRDRLMLERIRQYPLSNGETVENRLYRHVGQDAVSWSSGELCSWATVKDRESECAFCFNLYDQLYLNCGLYCRECRRIENIFYDVPKI